MSTSIQETSSIHGVPLLSQNELGQYVDYHAALSDTVTTDSDYDNPLKDLNAISTKLSTDSDTYSLSPKKCIQIIDHDIASSHDSACEIAYVPNSNQSSYSGDDSAFHDISPAQATATIGAHQSLSIAGGHDDVTVDSS